VGARADAIIAKRRKLVGDVCKALLLEIDANLRRSPDQGGTPVATGHARANWVPSLGTPHTGEVADDGAHDAGIETALAFVLGQGPLYESNSAPYINALNYGHSKQAPSMFIERCVDEALQTMQQQLTGRLDLSSVIAKMREAIGAAGFVHALNAMAYRARKATP